jgi:hypothetical protein
MPEFRGGSRFAKEASAIRRTQSFGTKYLERDPPIKCCVECLKYLAEASHAENPCHSISVRNETGGGTSRTLAKKQSLLVGRRIVLRRTDSGRALSRRIRTHPGMIAEHRGSDLESVLYADLQYSFEV